MIALWVFLLLAVVSATGSGNAPSCLCPCNRNKEVKSTFEEHSSKLTAIKKDQLDLGSLLGGVLSSVASSVSNVAVAKVEFQSGGFRGTGSSLQLGCRLGLHITTKQYPVLNVTLDITVPVTTAIGAQKQVIISYVESQVKFVLSINNRNELGLIGNIIIGLVQALLTLLIGVCHGILQILFAKINYLNAYATGTFYHGITEYKHQITSIQVVESSIFASIQTLMGGNTITWPNADNIQLGEDEQYALILTSEVVFGFLSVTKNWLLYETAIAKKFLIGHEWAVQYTSLSFRASFKEAKSCRFSSKGVHVAATLEFVISDGKTSVATVEAEVELIGATTYTHGKFGFSISEDYKAAYTFTVTKSSCGCDAGLIAWISEYLSYYESLFKGKYNCHWGAFLQLPVAWGTPGHEGSCVSDDKICRCGVKKPKE